MDYNLLCGVLFVPLHRVIDKLNEYDSRIHH